MDVATHYMNATSDGVVTTMLKVVNAQQEDFTYSNITCFATNEYGTKNATIPLQQIRKFSSISGHLRIADTRIPRVNHFGI